MDKINATNANLKVDTCVDEMLSLRKITFEDFEREFKREETNWKNWKWKQEDLETPHKA